VHDTVADTDETVARQVLAHVRQEMVERAVVPELGAFAP